MTMERVSGVKKAGRYEVPSLTLRDMLRPLFRRWLLMLLTFCLVFFASVFVAWYWATGYYETNMQIVVGRERLDPAVTPQPTAAVQAISGEMVADDVASEVTLLQGTDILREVGLACKLAKEESYS